MSGADQGARQLTDRVRRHIYWRNGTLPALAFTGLAWSIAGAYFFFGIDLARHHGAPDRSDSYFFALLAIGTPVATAIRAWVKIRRALYLARNGVQVTAKVTSLGIAASHSQNVHYEYVVGAHSCRQNVATQDPRKGTFQRRNAVHHLSRPDQR